MNYEESASAAAFLAIIISFKITRTERSARPLASFSQLLLAAAGRLSSHLVVVPGAMAWLYFAAILAGNVPTV